MMNGYPLIYWVVVLIVAGAVSAVLIVAGAVSAVLIGIGYLLGLKVGRREAIAGLKAIEHSVDRLNRVMGKPITFRVPL